MPSLSNKRGLLIGLLCLSTSLSLLSACTPSDTVLVSDDKQYEFIIKNGIATLYQTSNKEISIATFNAESPLPGGLAQSFILKSAEDKWKNAKIDFGRFKNPEGGVYYHCNGCRDTSANLPDVWRPEQ